MGESVNRLFRCVNRLFRGVNRLFRGVNRLFRGVNRISDALNAHVKGASFTYVTAALSEAALITELQAGRPVLRLTSGHIDIVSGCRSSDGSYAGAK